MEMIQFDDHIFQMRLKPSPRHVFPKFLDFGGSFPCLRREVSPPAAILIRDFSSMFLGSVEIGRGKLMGFLRGQSDHTKRRGFSKAKKSHWNKLEDDRFQNDEIYINL